MSFTPLRLENLILPYRKNIIELESPRDLREIAVVQLAKRFLLRKDYSAYAALYKNINLAQALDILKQKETTPPYKIDPLPLKPYKDSPQASCVDQFQSECDFTITCIGNKCVPTHRALLLKSGDMITSIVSSRMKEDLTGSIDFPDFSATTVEAYLVLLFSGGEELLDELLKGAWKDLKIMELLEFAYRHQNQDLLNCCINYLSIHTSVKDVQTIADAAERYDLPPLRQLSRALAQPQHELILPEIIARAEQFRRGRELKNLASALPGGRPISLGASRFNTFNIKV